MKDPNLLATVFASLLYSLVVDAALETYWSGSPVWWRVVAAVAIYGLATVLFWRRSTALRLRLSCFQRRASRAHWRISWTPLSTAPKTWGDDDAHD